MYSAQYSKASTSDDMVEISGGPSEGATRPPPPPAEDKVGCCTTYQCIVLSFVLLVLIIILACAALAVAVPLYLQPEPQDTGYQKAKCVVERSYIAEERADCNCGSKGRCFSSYQCLHIEVSFDTGDHHVERVIMYENDFSLKEKECSFEPECINNKWQNDEEVKEYKEKWGSGTQKFNCYYESSEPTYAIRKINQPDNSASSTMILHLILWPTVAIVLSLLGISCICLRHRKQMCQKVKECFS